MEQLAKQLNELAEEILDTFYDDIAEKESQIDDLQEAIKVKDAEIEALDEQIKDKDLEINELQMKLKCFEGMEFDFETESEDIEAIKDILEEEEEEEEDKSDPQPKKKESQLKSEDLYPAFAIAEQQKKKESDQKGEAKKKNPPLFMISKGEPKPFPFAFIDRANDLKRYNRLWAKFKKIRDQFADLQKNSIYDDKLKEIAEVLYKKKTTPEEMKADFQKIKEGLEELTKDSKTSNVKRCQLIMESLSEFEEYISN